MSRPYYESGLPQTVPRPIREAVEYFALKVEGEVRQACSGDKSSQMNDTVQRAQEAWAKVRANLIKWCEENTNGTPY